MHHHRATKLLAPILAVLVACGGATPASQLVRPPEFQPHGQSKCSVKTSQAEPLIVEWPPAERGRLEADIHTGVVAVRYDGCEMKLLPYCKVKQASDGSTYKYVPLTRKADSVHIANEDQLYANLPMGAVSLEGKLKEAGSLDVEMTLVGRWESGRGEARRRDMEGDGCEHATHIISAITVGAFTFSAGGSAEVGGGVNAFGAGAGGNSASHKETLSQDGDTGACNKATNRDTDPPDDCGALLRIEVVPIREGGEIASSEPPPSATGTTVEPVPSPPPPVPTSTEPSSSLGGTEPAPVPTTQEPGPTEPPQPFPTQPRSYPTYNPPATSTSTYNLAASGSAGGSTGGGNMGRGTLGTIVGWSATGALLGGALLGALGYATANSEVGSNATSSDCDTTNKTCTQAGFDAKNRALIEAGIGDGLMGLGIVLGVVYFFLPRNTPSTTVSVAPANHGNGGTVQVGGAF
jgi:hypothetical protein